MPQQESSLAKETAADAPCGQLHPNVATGARRLGKPVMGGEGPVGHGPVGVEQFQQAAVPAQDFGKDGDGLAPHVVLQGVVEVGVVLGVDGDAVEGGEVKPLLGEVAEEGGGARVVEETVDLAGENLGTDKLALVGEGDEGGVGRRIGEEVGQAGGEFVVGEGLGSGIGLAWVAGLDDVEEV